MKIGILQTGHVPPDMKATHGDYGPFFERLLAGNGFEFGLWDVENMVLPEGVHDADGWLITGSKHAAYEDHTWIAPLEDHIRAAYAAGVPVVGICFGHQIIAQALGGKVVKYPGGWAVGRQSYEISGEGSRAFNAWHQDQVVALPDGADVIARSDFCANAALIYADRAFSVQWHPEFDDAFIDGLIRHRGKGVVPDALLERASAELGKPLASAETAAQIAAFFKMARTHGGDPHGA